MRSMFAVIVIVMLAGAVHAGPLEDGLAALNKGDYATAIRLWRPLAEQGYATAQYNLGFMYANGEGVPQDYVEAHKWWRLAADQGHASAQYNLGVMYDNGRGLPQDYVEALKWYRLAAEQGTAEAQVKLGIMYYTGRGVPQDYVEAHKWYNLAASRYAPGEDRDGVVKLRDSLAADMTREQIAEAQERAREWKSTGQ